MLKFEEAVFDWQNRSNMDQHIGIVLGIDGTVQYLWHTYVNIYELLTSGNSLEDATEKYNDGLYYIEIFEGTSLLETIQVPEIVWALLLSDCAIIEIARYATSPKTYEEMGETYFVDAGWTYQLVDGVNKVSPPVGWVAPVKKTLQEQYDYQVSLIHKLSKMIESNPDADQYYVEVLDSAKSRRDTLHAQIEVENGKQ